MLNSASRSCCEKTSKATIVCVRRMPGTRASRLVTTSAICSGAAHPQHRDVVPLARHRPRLGDAVDVGERAAEVRHRLALGLDQDDGVGHRTVCVSPGARMTTLVSVAFSTSDLNASASVSIGGNVS